MLKKINLSNRGIYLLIHASNPWQRQMFLQGLKNSSLPSEQWRVHFKDVQHDNV